MFEHVERRSPLRFVILCDSFEFEQWQASCIRDTLSSNCGTVVGLVMRQSPAKPDNASKWKSRWSTRRLALWRLFQRLYSRRFSKAIVREDLSELLEGIPSISDVPVRSGRVGEELSVATIEFIKELNPDFILRFSYGILRGEVLDIAPYGVWSFHHGDPSFFRGQPPGFWEILNNSPVTGAVLQVLSNELDAGRILHRGQFSTIPQSYAKTRDSVYLGTSSWVRRTCANIQINGWSNSFDAEPSKKGPIYKQPTNGIMIRFFWKTLVAFVGAQVRYRLYQQNWNCGIIREPISTVSGLDGLAKQLAALQRVEWMKPPNGQFYADPFGVIEATSGCLRVFFELFSWKEGRGSIASAVFDGTSYGPVTSTLSAETHLSYPYPIQQGDLVFIVPEHSEAKDVSAFAVEGDGQAVRKKSIFRHVKYIDTTFIEWSGKVWAFALLDTGAPNTELHLFYAEEFDGPWRAHPLNPVKTDVTSARPAGTPFVFEGRLYRPGQDCASHYGSAVTVNEVLLLTETMFKERAVSRVLPDPTGKYPYGLHTLSRAGDYTLIDGAVNAPRFW